MAYELSDDEAMIAKVVGELAASIGLEAAADFDRHDTFPEGPIQEAFGLGLGLLGLPDDLGGAGAGPTAYAVAIQQIATVCPNTAAVLAVHNGLSLRLLAHADEAVRSDVIAAVQAGGLVATLATEEVGGSDHRTPATTATKDDGYRLTGHKAWGVGASHAGHFLVLASADDGPAWFVVPRDAEGLDLGRSEALLGLRGAGIRTVYLTDVHVPEGHRIPGDAMAHLADAQAWMQVGVASAINGCVEGAFEAAARFAESRVQFGKAIGHYQAVSDGVGRIDVHLAASQSLTREAAALLAHGGKAARVAAARAKLFATEMAIPMTRQAIRIQGGTGFMREGGTERFARDVRALQFMGEPEAVQRDTIRRHVLDLEFADGP